MKTGLIASVIVSQVTSADSYVCGLSLGVAYFG